MRRRDLREDERELWEEVTRDVRRAPRRKRNPKAAEPPTARKPEAPRIAPKPLPVARVAAAPKPAKPRGLVLDGATSERLKKGKVEPDAVIDLHGMTQAQAHARLVAFVRRGHERGERCLLVITGKGSVSSKGDARGFVMPERSAAGVLRTMAPLWLEEMRALVVGVQSAHRKHGGDGAFYVYLKRTKGAR
jgi:DNA-nicking Smr family endonuclease